VPLVKPDLEATLYNKRDCSRFVAEHAENKVKDRKYGKGQNGESLSEIKLL
jgi:hypothetical protein